MNEKVVLLGAGNVATHLAAALLKTEYSLCQIYSRTMESARILGMRTGVSYTNDTTTVYPDADYYIFSVSDSAIAPLFKSLKIPPHAIVLHTSGSQSLKVFGSRENCGVLYPLQTFSRDRMMDFKEIPLLIEAGAGKTLGKIREMACSLSGRVREFGTSQRKLLHMAAVFACNFVNHMYYIAGNILEKEDMDFKLLLPLISETAGKVAQLSPESAQTGPARRNDEIILNMHRRLLRKEPEMLEIYNMLTASVAKVYEQPEEEFSSEDNRVCEPDAPYPTLW